jgi:hypothetical protein
MKKLHIGIWVVLALLAATSCFKDADFSPVSGESGSRTQPGRLPSEETRQVMIMYSAGFNSLSGALTTDLRQMEEGFVPTAQSRADHILLVLSRHTHSGYSTPVAPVLYRLYKDREGNVVRDTLLRWKPEDQACDPAVLREVMTFAKEKFPAKGYGLVLSSHGSGWIPSPDALEIEAKSIGQDADTGQELEMDLPDFVNALPYKLDYILLDACYMACVEVAWALKDKTKLVGFSPTEIMSDGFNYLTLADRLLRSEPDALGVCTDYFAQYTDPRQGSPYASITLVDAGAMQPLADICKTLFERYRGPISRLSKTQVQRYFRWNQNPRFEHLYDLRHMLQQAGATEADLAQFDAALKKCVLYEAHTERFMSLWLTNVCGLSVYLPSSGDDDLNQYYMNQVEWNNATELIK